MSSTISETPSKWHKYLAKSWAVGTKGLIAGGLGGPPALRGSPP